MKPLLLVTINFSILAILTLKKIFFHHKMEPKTTLKEKTNIVIFQFWWIFNAWKHGYWIYDIEYFVLHSLLAMFQTNFHYNFFQIYCTNLAFKVSQTGALLRMNEWTIFLIFQCHVFDETKERGMKVWCNKDESRSSKKCENTLIVLTQDLLTSLRLIDYVYITLLIAGF